MFFSMCFTWMVILQDLIQLQPEYVKLSLKLYSITANSVIKSIYENHIIELSKCFYALHLFIGAKTIIAFFSEITSQLHQPGKFRSSKRVNLSSDAKITSYPGYSKRIHPFLFASLEISFPFHLTPSFENEMLKSAILVDCFLQLWYPFNFF